MLQLSDITQEFANQTVLAGVSLHIGENSRIGLIGRNGCGKSTLLRIMMGELTPDGGTITRAPGLRINCLTQEPRITPGNTLETELKSVFTDALCLWAEEAELISQLETLAGDAAMQTLHRLDSVQETLRRLDAQEIDARINRMLVGLGFSLAEKTRPVELFSGGWQMRINLAKVLLGGANLLLLDEPTNHLDLDACEWLEGFLREYPGGIVVVSHDRRFLDQLVTQTAEVELGRLTLYPGNYTAHLALKADMLERQDAAVDRQEKMLAKQTAFVERFRASATKSTQAKSREKQLARIERLERTVTNTQQMSVRFPVPQASGRQVMTLRKLAKGYDGKLLFKNVTADLHRQQRVFLLGANGCGKTTILRLLLGLESADSGEIKPGHNVVTGYFSQHQLETLDPAKTVFNTLHDMRPALTDNEVRGLLARFLFTGEQVFKPVSVLSGGEKSKLALARLMLSGPNTLLLDEPTNHMDIAAKEVLEDAFREYEGTILCISHDRYFIQQLATEIWEIYEGQLLQYPGDYGYYLEKRAEVRARYTPSAPVAAVKSAISGASDVAATLDKPGKSNQTPLRERREQEKQLARLEREIIKLEAELKTLETELNNPALQQDYAALEALSQQAGAQQVQLNELNLQWETVASRLMSESSS